MVKEKAAALLNEEELATFRLKKSLSSFIWLSFESHHAPDTAAAEWNLNNSCPLQQTFGIQKMLNISLGLREMPIEEFRF